MVTTFTQTRPVSTPRPSPIIGPAICERAGREVASLLPTVRTHIGKNDEAYRSVYQEEDAAGIRGVRLSKQIMQIAGDALKSNIATLGPLVLPVSEQLKFVVNLVARRALSGKLPAGVRGVARTLASRLLPWCPGYKGGAPAPARPPQT